LGERNESLIRQIITFQVSFTSVAAGAMIYSSCRHKLRQFIVEYQSLKGKRRKLKGTYQKPKGNRKTVILAGMSLEVEKKSLQITAKSRRKVEKYEEINYHFGNFIHLRTSSTEKNSKAKRLRNKNYS
jgi:hypothetical protein